MQNLNNKTYRRYTKIIFPMDEKQPFILSKEPISYSVNSEKGEIRNKIKLGVPKRKLASEYKMSVYKITKIQKADPEYKAPEHKRINNPKGRPRKKILTQEQNKKVDELISLGVPNIKICKKLNISLYILKHRNDSKPGLSTSSISSSTNSI